MDLLIKLGSSAVNGILFCQLFAVDCFVLAKVLNHSISSGHRLSAVAVHVPAAELSRAPFSLDCCTLASQPVNINNSHGYHNNGGC